MAHAETRNPITGKDKPLRESESESGEVLLELSGPHCSDCSPSSQTAPGGGEDVWVALCGGCYRMAFQSLLHSRSRPAGGQLSAVAAQPLSS